MNESIVMFKVVMVYILLLMLLCSFAETYANEKEDADLEDEIEKEMHKDPLDPSASDAIIVRNNLAHQAEAEEEHQQHSKMGRLLHEDRIEFKELKEADLKLDQKDIELENENMNSAKDNALSRRGMIPYARKLWIYREVPYEFRHSGTYKHNSGKVKNEVLKAMNTISKKSCITFRQKTSSDKNWLNIKRGSGCYSGIGRKYWKTAATELSLGEGCINQPIILHEIYHSLGFFHEQSRPDRDSYVRIDFTKVNPGMTSNFDKHQSYEDNVQQTPYDFLSLMHYGIKAFTIDGSQTIFPKFGGNQQLGGDVLSSNDQKELNKMYHCDSKSDWASWSNWSPCYEDWRQGCISVKQRFCTVKDHSRCPGADEFGVEEKFNNCEQKECDDKIVQPQWGAWGEYDTCSMECGDGYHIRDRKCENPPPKDGKSCIGHPTQTTLCRICRCNPDKYLNDADFERGFEPWRQDNAGDLQWQIIRGNTPNAESGPTSSYITSQYAFLYSKNSAENERRGRIISNKLKDGKAVCVTFYYQMNGRKMGQIQFFIKTDSGDFKLYWSKKGHQGDEWIQGSFSIPKLTEAYEIVLEGKTGMSPHTDMAVDDIRITNGLCIKGSEGCKDHYENCELWKSYGECYKNYAWMLRSCCTTCSSMAECENDYDKETNRNKCTKWAQKGECRKNKLWMWKNCCNACRECADTSEYVCNFWSNFGWCDESLWMKEHCKSSCNICKA